MSHWNSFDQLKIPLRQFLQKLYSSKHCAHRDAQSATVGIKFTLDWFHYFQLPSIAKISMFMSTNKVLQTDITWWQSPVFSCVFMVSKLRSLQLIDDDFLIRCVTVQFVLTHKFKRTKYLYLPSNFTLNIFTFTGHV